MNADSLPFQIIITGGISIAVVCYVIGMLGDYRRKKSKEEKRRFIFDASLFTTVLIAYFATIPLLGNEMNRMLTIPFVIFCGYMVFRFKKPRLNQPAQVNPCNPPENPRTL